MIDEILATLLASDIIVASRLAAMENFVKSQEALSVNVKDTKPTRAATMKYRGFQFPCPVCSDFDEYVMREAIAIEGLAVNIGLLMDLLCESGLVTDKMRMQSSPLLQRFEML